MAGDVCKLVGTLITNEVIQEDIVLDLPTKDTIECCFELTVLADTVGVDKNKNDKSSEFFQKNIAVTTSELFLEKNINGVWTELVPLIDGTFGTFYPFGFWSVTDQFNSIGFVLDWYSILNSVAPDFGAGSYRIRCDHSVIGGSTVIEYGCEYCLKTYRPELADGTIKFQYFTNGLIGNKRDRKTQLNFGRNITGGNRGWFSELRVHGFFGFESRDQEQEFRQFKNKSKQQLSNVQTPTFTAFIDDKYLPMYVHKKLMSMFQASEIFVTDFNQGINPDVFIDVPVIPSGSYEPEYVRGNKNSKVILNFEQKFNQFKWKPC